MRRALADLVPREILWRKTKGGSGRDFMVALEANWTGIAALLESPLSVHMGYIAENAFEQALSLVKHGEYPEFLRRIKALSLELWLRDLVKRGIIIRVPMQPFMPRMRANLAARGTNA